MEKRKVRHLHLSAAQRLAFRFSLLIAAIILLLSMSLIFALRYNVRRRQNRELIRAMDTIAAALTDSMNHQPPPFPSRSGTPPSAPGPGGRRMPVNTDIPYYITFTIYRAGSKDIIDTNDPFLPQLPLTDGRTERYTKKDYFTDGDLNILYCAKQYGTVIPGSYTIQAALNMDSDTAEQLLAGLPLLLLISILPLLVVSYFAAYFITKQTIRPVEQMTEAARRIGSANLGSRLPLTGRGDELDTLASTFNELFARLKTDFDRERQFTADVSHELKTPLAVIQGHANLIRRWGKDDPVQLEKSLASLLNETHSMEAIISNLLQISRLESGQVTLNTSRIELTPLFKRLADDTAAWAPAVSFDIRSPDGLAVRADGELLYQACTIIVSNSVKFAGASASLHIIASPAERSGFVDITIADNGPGIKPDALPHIFERFYRGDPSHNRKAGGSGLGLAIVKSIMQVSGGSVRAESTDGTGTAIIMEIPSI